MDIAIQAELHYAFLDIPTPIQKSVGVEFKILHPNIVPDSIFDLLNQVFA